MGGFGVGDVNVRWSLHGLMLRISGLAHAYVCVVAIRNVFDASVFFYSFPSITFAVLVFRLFCFLDVLFWAHFWRQKVLQLCKGILQIYQSTPLVGQCYYLQMVDESLAGRKRATSSWKTSERMRGWQCFRRRYTQAALSALSVVGCLFGWVFLRLVGFVGSLCGRLILGFEDDNKKLFSLCSTMHTSLQVVRVDRKLAGTRLQVSFLI